MVVTRKFSLALLVVVSLSLTACAPARVAKGAVKTGTKVTSKAVGVVF